MNRVILMGRLTRDPEVRYSSGERSMAIARYTLAVDRRGRRSQGGSDQQSADFIPCVAFDRSGEFAEKYFRQGMRVLISGRIQTGSYTNREGQKVYTTEVIVDDQEFADSKGAGAPMGGGSGNYGGASAGDAGYTGGEKPDPQSASTEGFMNIPDGVEDEGLPFN
ncbi:MAG: single-stranded DNA-binding protein [Stomatobaculum sp.]